MKNRTHFALNRLCLLCIAGFSLIFPFIHIDALFIPNIIEIPFEKTSYLPTADQLVLDVAAPMKDVPEVMLHKGYTWLEVFLFIYKAGLTISILTTLAGLIHLFIILINSNFSKREYIRIAHTKKKITPMSFGLWIILPMNDQQKIQNEIFNHEQEHIKLKHSLDLLLFNFIKWIQWFNPFIYLLGNDLKSIHEYQVDERMVKSGIELKKYQLLIIEKCVGSEKFALANNFNHCQIKNRIVMMNKKKKSKPWRIGIFLPAIALLLMAFSNKNELPASIQNEASQHVKKWSEKDFHPAEHGTNHRENAFFEGYKTHMILMNRYSQILLDGEKASFSMVQSTLENSLPNVKNGNYKIFIQKDVNTDMVDYLQLLNIVGNTITSCRENASQSKFQGSYSALNDLNKTQVEKAFPLNVYIVLPKNIKNVNHKNIQVRANETGVFVNGIKTPIEQLSERIRKLQDEAPGKTTSLKVDKFCSTEMVQKIKQQLRLANIQHVNYKSK